MNQTGDMHRDLLHDPCRRHHIVIWLAVTSAVLSSHADRGFGR